MEGHNSPFWKDGRNVIFKENAIQPGAGHRLLMPRFTGTPITGLKATIVSGVPTLFLGSGTKLYAWDETNGATEEGTGFTDGARWVFARWGNWVVATNNVEAVQIWKGTSFANLTGPAFTRARVLFPFKNFLIAANTSIGSDHVTWCDTDDIEDWTATASNAAGDYTIRGLNGPLMCGLTHKDRGWLLSEDQLHRVEYIGTPFTFSIKKSLDGIGAVGPYAVTSTGDLLYGFGPEGIWRSDGFSKDYIDTPSCHRFIYNQLNNVAVENVVVWHDAAQESISFYFPANDATFPNLGAEYNYSNGTWSFTTLAWAVAEGKTTFDFAILGNQLGDIYYQDPLLHPTGADKASTGVMPFRLVKAQGNFPFGHGKFGAGIFGGYVKIYG